MRSAGTLRLGLLMFSGDFGGMEKVVLSLAAALPRSGCEVVLFVVEESRAGEDRLARLRLPLQAFAGSGSKAKLCTLTTSSRWSGALRDQLRRHFAAEKIDLVHCHCYKSAFYLARMHGAAPPFVVTLHGLFLSRSPGSLFILYAYYCGLLRADAIICCSQYLFSHLLTPALRRKARLIHNGLAESETVHVRAEARRRLLARWGLGEDDFLVAGVGRLAPEKNFSLFVDIARALAGSRARLLVIGAGAEEEMLRERAAGLDNIVFAGFVSDIELLYAGVDLFLMTSNVEGISMALLEAMRAGLPVVATAVGGNTTILTSGENGLLFAKGDVDGGAEAVRQMMTQPGLCARLGAAARRRWREEFSIGQQVTRQIALYQTVLNERRR